MIEKYLNVRHSLKNLSDDEFEKILPTLAKELEQVSFYPNFTEDELLKDWRDLLDWNKRDTVLSSGSRLGMKLCEHFFPNFYDIENNKGVSFKSLWNASHLEKVLRWNRNSHSTPYLSELKRGIYFTSDIAKSTMYRPQMAKLILSNLGGFRVLDPCAGWGGRLLGIVSARADYIAFEPNSETYDNLIELVEFLNIKNKVTLIKDSALNMNNYDIGEVDLVLTSPPYFDLEVYSHEDTQSIHSISTYSEWVDKFLKPLIELSTGHLSKTGYSCWNVHNLNKMPMIDDVKDIHVNWEKYATFQVVSSKRQVNQTDLNNKKKSDITICYRRKLT